MVSVNNKVTFSINVNVTVIVTQAVDVRVRCCECMNLKCHCQCYYQPASKQLIRSNLHLDRIDPIDPEVQVGRTGREAGIHTA
jgi:hypothetical protein